MEIPEVVISASDYPVQPGCFIARTSSASDPGPEEYAADHCSNDARN